MPEAEPKEAALELKPLLAGLRAFVERTRRFPRLAERREALLSNLRALEAQEGNLKGSLLVLLLGGTGTGKSTLINALAGREIAEASDLRPCTRRITFFTHEENDLAPIRAAIGPKDVLATHRDEGLRRKILIDPPDFDSTVRENRDVLEKILAVSDLVLVLADREKYRNDSLYRLLSPHRGSKRFLFCLNKTDVLHDARVLEDFRASIAASGFESPEVIALSALAASRGDAAAAGDFPRLQAILREEITRIRIREIKESNVLALLRHVADAIGEALPPGARDGILAWARSSDSGSRDVAGTVREEACAALFGDGGLVDAIAGAEAEGTRGVFGAWLLAVSRARALLRPIPGSQAPSGVLQAKALTAGRMEKADARRIADAARTNGRRRRESLRNLGIDPGAEEGDGVAEASARDALSAARAEAVEGISKALADAGEGGLLRARDLAYNLPPLALIATVTAAATMRFVKGDPPGLEFLAGGAVLLVLLCAVEGLAAGAGFRRRARRATAEIEERIGKAAFEAVQKAFGPADEALAKEVLDALADFDRLKKEAEANYSR
jgi:energy-coupling factor transporter ATP-binding protein EcfA2